MSGPSTVNDRSSGGGRREGSRLLLAAALLAGIAAAVSVGSLVPEFLARILGISSNIVRLALKTALVIVALPAMFYLVERLFLGRASKRKRTTPPS